MVWLLLWLAGAASAGWLALSLGSRRPVPALDRALLALPIGLLITAILQFLANWPLGIPVTAGSVLGCVAAANLALLGASRVFPSCPAPGPLPRLDRRSWLLVAGAGAVVVGFSGALLWIQAGRTIEGWDFYSYHWHFTRIIVSTGYLPTHAAPTVFDSQYAYPPFMFLLYAQISVLLGGLSQLGPRALPLLFTIASVLVAARLARVTLRLSLPAALVAGAFVLWKQDYPFNILQEGTDTAAVFFTLCAAWYLLRGDLAPGSRVIGTGVALSGAYWARYDGLTAFLVMAVVQAAVILWLGRDHPAFRQELKVGAVSLGLGAVLISPHLLRNLVLWHNPLYPAFSGLFGGYLIDPWVRANLLSYTTAKPFEGLPWYFWIRPFHYLPATGPTLALLAAAALPVAAALRRRDPKPALLWLGAAMYLLAALLFLRVPDDADKERHLMAMTALAAPLCGLLFETLTARSRLAIWTWLAGAALISWFILENLGIDWGLTNLTLLLVIAIPWLAPRSRLLGPHLRAGFRTDLMAAFVLPFFVVFMALARAAPPPIGFTNQAGLLRLPESPVLSALPQDARYLTFDNRVEVLGGNPFPGDDPSLERFYVDQLSGAEGVNALKALGVRYIFWFWPEPWDHSPQNPLMSASPLFAELDDPHLFALVWTYHGVAGHVALYALR